MATNTRKTVRPFPETDLYCITAEIHSKGRDNIEVVKQMIAAGVRIIQYREKEKSMKEKYEQCLRIRELTRHADVFFIVNDHVDLAVLVKADGLHLGQDDLPIKHVREIIGGNMLIGMSTHSPDQATAAVAQGADYIGVGPIFKTYTKKDVCDPVGFEYLEHVVASQPPIPFITIGGIKSHNIEEILNRGAKCTALVTEIVGADNIGKKIAEIRRIIRRQQ